MEGGGLKDQKDSMTCLELSNQSEQSGVFLPPKAILSNRHTEKAILVLYKYLTY